MNKYIYCECNQDYWPEIKTLMANSYNDAVDKVITRYGNKLEDDKIMSSIDDWDEFREYLNETYTIALSDLEEYDEL